MWLGEKKFNSDSKRRNFVFSSEAKSSMSWLVFAPHMFSLASILFSRSSNEIYLCLNFCRLASNCIFPQFPPRNTYYGWAGLYINLIEKSSNFVMIFFFIVIHRMMRKMRMMMIIIFIYRINSNFADIFGHL